MLVRPEGPLLARTLTLQGKCVAQWVMIVRLQVAHYIERQDIPTKQNGGWEH